MCHVMLEFQDSLEVIFHTKLLGVFVFAKLFLLSPSVIRLRSVTTFEATVPNSAASMFFSLLELFLGISDA